MKTEVNSNEAVPTTLRCCSPRWTTGLRPAVYKCNYTLLATHLPGKLTVLVCLAPGNSFHLYEMSAVEDGASLTHLSSLSTVRLCLLYVDVDVFHRVSYKRSEFFQENTAAASWSLWGTSHLLSDFCKDIQSSNSCTTRVCYSWSYCNQIKVCFCNFVCGNSLWCWVRKKPLNRLVE